MIAHSSGCPGHVDRRLGRKQAHDATGRGVSHSAYQGRNPALPLQLPGKGACQFVWRGGGWGGSSPRPERRSPPLPCAMCAKLSGCKHSVHAAARLPLSGPQPQTAHGRRPPSAAAALRALFKQSWPLPCRAGDACPRSAVNNPRHIAPIPGPLQAPPPAYWCCLLPPALPAGDGHFACLPCLAHLASAYADCWPAGTAPAGHGPCRAAERRSAPCCNLAGPAQTPPPALTAPSSWC